MTSGLHSEADIVATGQHVSKVPNSEVVASFDHLVGGRDEGRWNCEAKALSGLTIDDKLEVSGLVDWQISRLCSFKDPSNIDTCACRKLNPAILVMQSAQDWATKNVPGAIDGARDRRIFLQG